MNFHLFFYYFLKKTFRLEVTYANNNNLIKKFENMPSPEPALESGKKPCGKKSVNLKKSFAERSKVLIGVGKGKDVVNTDVYF